MFNDIVLLLAGWHICAFDNACWFTRRITLSVVDHCVGYFIHAENASPFLCVHTLRKKRIISKMDLMVNLVRQFTTDYK